MATLNVPESRIRVLREAPLQPHGTHVLYWMVANRRPVWNFSLDRAIALARELGKPLLVLEALRCDYPWASDRLHRFVLDGMATNAAAFEKAGILYHPYVEPERGAGKGLLRALAEKACAVVTDDFPTFFLPRMLAAATEQVAVRFEAVDSNGLYPMRDTPRVFPTAHAFRRHLQKSLRPHLLEVPHAHPLRRHGLPPHPGLPKSVRERWPRAAVSLLDGAPGALSALPIDHGVAPAPRRGGYLEAEVRLAAFLGHQLERYGEGRNEPDEEAASGFSPYLHFGFLSTHQIFAALAAQERWSPEKLGKATGSREGFWGMGGNAEAFLDELVTWRELGFNFASHRNDYDRYETLPPWALATLEKHRKDPRPRLYDFRTLDAGRTHDRIWNAAQRQLVTEGRIHNYLRMLWGKKVLEWSREPEEALQTLIALNDRYALDGRDPNSYSGILWVFGRYDRPWGPERPIFGTVRYMSSENTARKVALKKYLARFAPEGT